MTGMTTNSTTSRTYFFLILVSAFLQGSSFVATKIVLTEIAPLWTASLRFLVAALSLLPFMLHILRKEKLRLRDLPWPQLVLIGLLQTAGVMAFLNIGLTETTAATAAILMASNPLLVVILARIFLGEKVAAPGIFGLLLAFVGVVICIGWTGAGKLGIGRGEMLVMAASTCWAVSTVSNKRFNLSISPWVVTFWQMLVGTVILGILAKGYHQPFTLPETLYVWGAFFWLAIPASTGAMGLWFAALKIGGSVQTSGFLFLCPLFATMITFGLTHQLPQWHEVTGGILIGAGLYAMSKRKQIR